MVRILAALVLLVVAATPVTEHAASAQASAAPAQAREGARLPGTVVPEHYDLWFAPDLEKETFRGRETIRVQVLERSNEVTLHAAEIAFGEVTITSGGRTQTAQVTVDEKTERATLTVPQPLAEGPATIQIAYTGILNDKLRGFYISTANGRKYAVTQMEPTDARRAFPSFDEPALKATFDISMTVPAGDVAISNGRVVSDTPGPEPGTHTMRFARTAKMSTYLVAMTVGDFVCRSGQSDGTPLRICSTPDKRELTAFALDAAVQQLRFFNDYFGIKYPFDKLDIIAVPDFAAGAMENTGAILFRERLLLIDPAQSSVDQRKRVASIISHEIAHQWFGNLVTMKWWDDIWLNEGFATWIASKPIEAWKPEWKMSLDDALSTQGALGLDALRTTRAIRTKVETPEEINQVFDGIAYQKTAGVLRMVEGFVGAEAFRKAVASYVQRFSYANAAGEDFWREVARVTGRPVDRILSSYVDQPGAPVLKVENRCTAGRTSGQGSTTAIDVSQSRFFGNTAGTTDTAARPQVWTLPVCFKSSDGPKCQTLERPQQTFTAAGCDNVFANADARGYYLTEYTPAAVRTLGASARGLKPVERLSLLNDEWWMVRSGRHGIDAFLDLAAAMATDDTAPVVEAIADRLTYAVTYIADASERARFQEWIRGRFKPALLALGLPGARTDPDERQTHRATLLRLVGVVGADPEIQQRAREMATGYMANAASLSPTTAPVVLQAAASAGDAALYDQYVAQLAKLANDPESYYRYFNALPWFSDPALVRRTLEFALSDAVRSQDTGTLIASVLARPAGRAAAWAFTKENWTRLTQKLGTFQGIPAIVSALSAFCSKTDADDMRAFFTKNPVPAADRALRQSVERVEACTELDARQSDAFAKWLAASR